MNGLFKLTRLSSSSLAVRPFSTKLVYEGPMSHIVRTMKGVSITSCSLSAVAMPSVLYMQSSGAPIIGQIAMCGTVMVFGVGTTAMFHYLFRPYVSKLMVDTSTKEDPLLSITTYNVFARKKEHRFRMSQVVSLERSMHPMVSFQAGTEKFFIHPECFEDKDLLAKLLRPQRTARKLPQANSTVSM